MPDRAHTQSETSGWLSQRTDRCPSIPTFVRARKHGWPADLQKHILSCTYCQRTTAIGYRADCPSWLVLAQFKALGWNSRAVEFHLQHDHCRVCATALQSEELSRLAERLQGGPSIAQRAKRLLEQFVGGAVALTLSPSLPYKQPIGGNTPLDSTKRTKGTLGGVEYVSYEDGGDIVIFFDRVPEGVARVELSRPGAPPVQLPVVAGGLFARIPKVQIVEPLVLLFVPSGDYDDLAS